jgi:hypothetical protein
MCLLRGLVCLRSEGCLTHGLNQCLACTCTFLCYLDKTQADGPSGGSCIELYEFLSMQLGDVPDHPPQHPWHPVIMDIQAASVYHEHAHGPASSVAACIRISSVAALCCALRPLLRSMIEIFHQLGAALEVHGARKCMQVQPHMHTSRLTDTRDGIAASNSEVANTGADAKPKCRTVPRGCSVDLRITDGSTPNGSVQAMSSLWKEGVRHNCCSLSICSSMCRCQCLPGYSMSSGYSLTTDRKVCHTSGLSGPAFDE